MVICSTFYHKYVANIIWRTNFSHSDWSLCQSLKQSTDRLPGLGEIGSYCTFTTWPSGQKLFYMKHVFILWWEQISRFWWFFNPNIGGKQGERGELSTFTCLATLWTGKHDSIKCKRVNFHNYNASIAIAPMCQIFKIIMIESQDHNPSCFRGKDNLTSNMMGEVMRQVKTQKRVKLGWWTKCIYWCVSGFRGRWHNHHSFQFPSLWEISQPLLSRTGKKRFWERAWIKRRNDQIADIRLSCNPTNWLFWGRLRFFIGSHTKSSVWK